MLFVIHVHCPPSNFLCDCLSLRVYAYFIFIFRFVFFISFSLFLNIFTVHSPPRIIKQPPTDELLYQVAQQSNENDKPFLIECEAEGEPAPKYVYLFQISIFRCLFYLVFMYYQSSGVFETREYEEWCLFV